MKNSCLATLFILTNFTFKWKICETLFTFFILTKKKIQKITWFSFNSMNLSFPPSNVSTRSKSRDFSTVKSWICNKKFVKLCLHFTDFNITLNLLLTILQSLFCFDSTLVQFILDGFVQAVIAESWTWSRTCRFSTVQFFRQLFHLQSLKN